MRELSRKDLFYLLIKVLGRKDINREWLYDRCREVQAQPDGMVDLWARDHWKSSIITFGKTIQDIINDPEITIGIFSHTKPIARAFLRQIKTELENNERLKFLFPEILFENPRNESKNWSEDNGITVKRKGNPKEATVEAHGLVDGQPTSKHYQLSVYDDIVTRESVTSAEMIKKTTEAWELSLNLGTGEGRRRYIGTRYHFNDTWGTIIQRGSATPRIYPATVDGSPDGKPVLLTREKLTEKRRDMGSFTFACQMLLNPKADEIQGFSQSDLRYWGAKNHTGLNIYILVDPANEKKKENDYTAMWVVGASEDKNLYVITMVRDRLNLTERTKMLFKLHRQYQPKAVAYEQYGMQADIQHIEYVQEEMNYRFKITPVGGSMPKNDRIRRLIPVVEANRLFLPMSCIREGYDGRKYDLVQVFIDEEFVPFPIISHDDMLDCLAKIEDPNFQIDFPIEKKKMITPMANYAPLDLVIGY
jgi:predicted phage terminase large subunit-like protein